MARSVAESGIMLMMMAMRRAHIHCKFGTRSEHMVWGKDADIRVPQDCIIGIWGYGDVSKWVVPMLRPMEPKEIAVSSGHMSEEALAELGMTKCDVDELFAKSDVVFCLSGMTVANYHRIQEPQLQSMKDGAILINLGRAPLLDPDDLLAELKRGRIIAALDVYEKEPLAEDDPLNDLDNVILQPHNAGTGRDAHYMAAMLDEINRFYAGERLQYEIAQHRGEQMTDMQRVRKEKG
jgi:phosphoglycerate dehydrogenase-like enzyme